MKVLTLHQPWAQLVALGVKSIETRSWSTIYRGPLAIHAARRPMDSLGDLDPALASAINGGSDPGVWRLPVADYPLGAIVATCTLVDVVPIVAPCTIGDHGPTARTVMQAWPGHLEVVERWPHGGQVLGHHDDQLPYGDFTVGGPKQRYAWLLADVVPVDPPVPFKGGQGLSRSWEPNDETVHGAWGDGERPASSKPRLLDLFCKAGGATKGYQRAGFYVVGVDIEPQPHYCGDEFYQADALTFPLDGFDAIHASPPCQDHSSLSSLHEAHGTGWMLGATIERLKATGLPWVVENVEGRTVTMDGWWFTLCGSSFGLGVRRHRRFGSNQLMLAPCCRHYEQPHPIGVTGHGAQGHEYRRGLPVASQADRRAAMGIDWMTQGELTQAIPPAYTEWIGAQLLAALEAAA